jgi:hypothetical protein
MFGNQIDTFFRCPDDGGQLRADESFLECGQCGKTFTRKAPRVFDLNAATPKAVESTAQSGYESIHAVPFSLADVSGVGWGDLQIATAGTRAFVKHERQFISALLGRNAFGFMVDVSGGVGNYSGFLAEKARTVVHCELHVPSLLHAWREHKSKPNMIFIRSDYLALGIADGIADAVVCTDTLVRGEKHERALLVEILRILKPDGRAVVDFQYHRFQRIQKRSPLVKCCDLENFLRLVSESGLAVTGIHGIGYVPARLVPAEWTYHFLDWLIRPFVQPSRFLLVLEHRH